ncbi:hypothetical protein BJ994_000727 [Arthrobacter pigmenti]|uniref:Uncharacterized protein n=1 Tax=Arthrobacter pigmenti TaxID=271432 RepID=A0A846RTP8_9MICC|nr:hypothetical protein [Arthrobacter pigmenti]
MVVLLELRAPACGLKTPGGSDTESAMNKQTSW